MPIDKATTLQRSKFLDILVAESIGPFHSMAREGDHSEAMETPLDFKDLQERIQKSLVSAVKNVNRIAAEDLSFQRTVNPDVAEHIDEKAARVLDLSAQLLGSAAKACGVKAPTLEDAEDIDMSWQAIVDVVDSVLEKADTALDEYTGLIKRREPPSADSVRYITVD